MINVSYPRAMQAVLRLEQAVFRQVLENGRGWQYSGVNVGLLGVIHAACSLHFARSAFETAGAVYVPEIRTALFVMMGGVTTAFLMHGALALVVWVFSRGMGGTRTFVPIYVTTGVAFIALWPVAPALAAMQAGTSNPLMLACLLAGTSYALVVVTAAVRSASGLSPTRTAISSVLALVYMGSFLYLWL